MTPLHLVADLLLALAVVLTLFCACGLLVLRDDFQRLHAVGPVTSLGVGLVVLAIWCEAGDAQTWIKPALVGAALFLSSAVLTHATARCIRLRGFGRIWADTDEVRGDRS